MGYFTSLVYTPDRRDQLLYKDGCNYLQIGGERNCPAFEAAVRGLEPGPLDRQSTVFCDRATAPYTTCARFMGVGYLLKLPSQLTALTTVGVIKEYVTFFC